MNKKALFALILVVVLAWYYSEFVAARLAAADAAGAAGDADLTGDPE